MKALLSHPSGLAFGHYFAALRLLGNKGDHVQPREYNSASLSTITGRMPVSCHKVAVHSAVKFFVTVRRQLSVLLHWCGFFSFPGLMLST